MTSNNVSISRNISQNPNFKFRNIYYLIFLILQPILDILAFFLLENGLSTEISFVIRVLVAMGIVILGLVDSEKKNNWIVFHSIIAILITLRALNLFRIGYDNIITDTINLGRSLYPVIVGYAIYNTIKKYTSIKETILLASNINLYIIAASILLSETIGPSNPTYPSSGIGMLGWFNSGNSQGVVITVLLCLSLVYSYEHNYKLNYYTSIFIGSTLLFLLGTRVSFLSLILIILGNIILLIFILNKKNKKENLVFIIVSSIILILSIYYYPQSPTYRQQSTRDHAISKQQSSIESNSKNNSQITEISTKESIEYSENKQPNNQDMEDQTINTTEKSEDNSNDDLNKDNDGSNNDNTEILEKLYLRYMPNFISKHGLQKTLEAYDYTSNADILSDARYMKQVYANINWHEADLLTKIFGLETESLRHNGQNFELENGALLILYYYGYLGFAIYVTFIIKITVIYIMYIFRNFKKRIVSYSYIIYLGAFLLSVGAGIFTGGVYIRPNVSIYIELIVVLILTNKDMKFRVSRELIT